MRAGTGMKGSVNRHVGPPVAPPQRGARTCEKQGVARVCGDEGHPRPRGPGGLRVYSGSGAQGRARAGGGAGRASCRGKGRAEGAPAGLGPDCRAPRPPLPGPPEAPRPALLSPAPWTEAGVRRNAAPTLVALQGGKGRTARSKSQRRRQRLAGWAGPRSVGARRKGEAGGRRPGAVWTGASCAWAARGLLGGLMSRT